MNDENKKENEQFDPNDITAELTDETKKGLTGLRKFIEYWDNDLKLYARNCIQEALPHYIELSQLSSDSDKFIKDNNIVAKRDDEAGTISYKHSDGGEISKDEQKVLDAFQKHGERIVDEVEKKGIIDFYAVHNISEMMFMVEHDVADFRNPAIRMIQVYSVFTDKDYYLNVFGEDSECVEEANKFRNLAVKIEYGFSLLKDVK